MTKQVTVLLAEDSRFLRAAASGVLERQGYRVYAAVDGEQAIKLAAENQPDIVLLDLILPKVQGMDVLKALRKDKATSHVPVIIFSSMANQQDFSAFAPVDFIAKDNLMLNALAERIQQHLANTPNAVSNT